MKDQSLFDEREKAYLKELNRNPIWNGILDKLTRYSKISRYRPGKDEYQEKKWIYESGLFDEQDRIVSLLKPKTGDSVK